MKQYLILGDISLFVLGFFILYIFKLRMNFHKVEVNKTVWEVPDRYQKLSAVGSGAYGQVWYELLISTFFQLPPTLTRFFYLKKVIRI